MKTAIHPKYFDQAVVICLCGNTFTTGSTLESISVSSCYKCHPFFTGEQKFVDTEGRVEKFQKKQKEAEVKQKIIMEKKQKKEVKEAYRPKTLREMLMGGK
ncbi:50S ribosomal protein L31 [Candidatus Gottesmanbacteria bacterium]|nr:50S ribosomal protein L31 [Candidatus Gottesmanbacteria bacterium]